MLPRNRTGQDSLGFQFIRSWPKFSLLNQLLFLRAGNDADSDGMLYERGGAYRVGEVKFYRLGNYTDEISVSELQKTRERFPIRVDNYSVLETFGGSNSRRKISKKKIKIKIKF